MKVLTAGIAFVTLFMSPCARADYFQLFDRDGRNYVALARVDVEGRSIYSDRYGRIQLTLPPGQHQAQVTVGATTRTVVLHTNGGDALKTVRLP